MGNIVHVWKGAGDQYVSLGVAWQDRLGAESGNLLCVNFIQVFLRNIILLFLLLRGLFRLTFFLLIVLILLTTLLLLLVLGLWNNRIHFDELLHIGSVLFAQPIVEFGNGTLKGKSLLLGVEQLSEEVHIQDFAIS